MLFEPHPREFFQPDKPHFRLTPAAAQARAARSRSGSIWRSCCASTRRWRAVGRGLRRRVLVQGLGVCARGGRLRLPLRQGTHRRSRDAAPCRRRAWLRRDGGGAGGGQAGEVFSSSAIRAELAQGDVAGCGGDAGPLVARQGHGDRRAPGAAPASASRRPTSRSRPERRWPTASTRCACWSTARPMRRRPISARGRPSTTGRRCWRCFCSTSTTTSTAARSRWTSSPTSATTAASTARRALTAQMQADCNQARQVLAEAPDQP